MTFREAQVNIYTGRLAMLKKIIFLITLIFLVCSFQGSASAQVMTLADARLAVKYEMGFDTSLFYPDSIIDWFLNQGAQQIAKYGYAVEKQDTIARSANTIQYVLNGDLVKIKGVHLYQEGLAAGYEAIDLIDVPAVGQTVEELMEVKRGYWYWGTRLTGVNIGFTPEPLGTDTVIVFYWAEANSLSSVTDTTLIPYGYHDLIIDYAVGKLWERQGRQDRGAYYQSKFWQLLGQKTQDRLIKWEQQRIGTEVVK